MTEQIIDNTDATEVVEEQQVTSDPEGEVTTTEETEPDTFPREYVERLREESARYRTRAQRADDLAHRLHTSLVAATGRLADPGDLDFDDAHLEDDAALEAALDDLIARKPHLASRRPRGDVGQGVSSVSAVSLAGLLRSRA